jgi:hypothetical protein
VARDKLNAPTAMAHDEHDDPMNTKRTPRIHREHRVIVAIVLERDVVTAFMRRLVVNRVLMGISVLGLSLLAADCRRPVVPPVAPPVVPPAVPAVVPPAVPAAQPVSQLDQSNMPPWEGGWSIIGRGSTVGRFTQTFTPLTSTLTSIEIDVMTGNRGRGGDRITVTILDGTRVLATASRSIQEGFDGLLPFDFPAPGVSVTPGAPLHLLAEDTNKDVFGWRYGLNTYPGGVAYFNGAPWNQGVFDFRFRTYGY